MHAAVGVAPATDRVGGGSPVRVAVAVLAACGLLAVAGGALSLTVLVSGEHGPRPIATREAPAGGAWAPASSFGQIAVERVERIAGRPHGPGHADPEARSDQIRVSVTLTNRLRRRIAYSPGQFRLRLPDAGTTISATNPNPPPGSIAAGQKLRQRLTFIVPAARTRFTVVFDDLGRAAPIPIALGSLPSQRKD